MICSSGVRQFDYFVIGNGDSRQTQIERRATGASRCGSTAKTGARRGRGRDKSAKPSEREM